MPPPRLPERYQIDVEPACNTRECANIVACLMLRLGQFLAGFPLAYMDAQIGMEADTALMRCVVTITVPVEAAQEETGHEA